MSIKSLQPIFQDLSQSLEKWYMQNKRALPWRQSRDPYSIWLSEVMLQQTTVQAVIPYFERFTQAFPTVADLAAANLEQVHALWSGLGYYSRANNLHRAAQVLALNGFPKSAVELIELPGFGPYTSRAVSSLAFGEKVGVLDGNVIRVLCRLSGEALSWWTPAAREKLQSFADALVQFGDPSSINQAMMELGATVCTPSNPTCLICPLQKKCAAFKMRRQAELPLKKERRKTEIWIWDARVILKNKKLVLVQNDYAPFLKGKLIFPGKVKKVAQKPRKFLVSHSITHHQIYVNASRSTASLSKNSKWVEVSQLGAVNPSSLLQKILAAVL